MVPHWSDLTAVQGKLGGSISQVVPQGAPKPRNWDEGWTKTLQQLKEATERLMETLKNEWMEKLDKFHLGIGSLPWIVKSNPRPRRSPSFSLKYEGPRIRAAESMGPIPPNFISDSVLPNLMDGHFLHVRGQDETRRCLDQRQPYRSPCLQGLSNIVKPFLGFVKGDITPATLLALTAKISTAEARSSPAEDIAKSPDFWLEVLPALAGLVVIGGGLVGAFKWVRRHLSGDSSSAPAGPVLNPAC